MELTESILSSIILHCQKSAVGGSVKVTDYVTGQQIVTLLLKWKDVKDTWEFQGSASVTLEKNIHHVSFRVLH